LKKVCRYFLNNNFICRFAKRNDDAHLRKGLKKYNPLGKPSRKRRSERFFPGDFLLKAPGTGTSQKKPVPLYQKQKRKENIITKKFN
jgi:hypothetical protein